MTISSHAAPQAYTRDTLSQAYAWLQMQGEGVRKVATTPDLLVSLYLRSRRQGDAGPSAPTVSSQNFKSDLRHLAEDLKQFEGAALSPDKVASAPTAAVTAPEAQFTEVSLRPAAKPTVSELPLDGRSLKMISEVRTHLNLGSDVEACRALIALGFEQMRTLFSPR